MSEPSPTTATQQPPATPPMWRRKPLGLRAAPSAPSPSPASATLALHPLVRRHYGVATAAIEELVDVVEYGVRLLIPGALVVKRSKDETSIKPYPGVKSAVCSNFSGITILVKSQRLMELL